MFHLSFQDPVQPSQASAHIPTTSKQPIQQSVPHVSTPRKRPLGDVFLPSPKRQQISSPRVHVQPQVTEHLTKTSASQKSELDLEIAKFFFACNIPFNVVQHPQWKRVCSKMRPGYDPPTRKQLAETLLDKVHGELKEDMKEALSGKTATLINDGWSNIHNEPVIASCLQVEKDVYFLDCHDTGSMTKSAENCKELTEESIKKAKEEFDCNVESVVTDNAKAMEKMRNELRLANPGIFVYGCSAHWLQLLGKDCSTPAITKHIILVQKFFRNHHKPQAWLSEKGGKKPILPGDTRWNSELDCIQNFLSNRCHYQKIIQDYDKEYSFDQVVVDKVNAYALCKNAMNMVEQLKPIASALDKCQSDGTSLADACDIWLDLLSNPYLEPHKKAVEKRFKDAIVPEHLAAYMLQLKYRGEKLTDKQSEKVSVWLVEQDPSFISTFISFQAKAAPFPRTYFTEAATSIPPQTWWQGLVAFGINSDFVKLAVRLVTSPASSASIERIFSTFSLIQTKIRNRLGVERHGKLVFCYRMLRGKQDLDW
jgi:hypothetical protein